MIVNETILHYIWQYQVYNFHKLFTTELAPLIIINQGTSNKNAGPDFSFAKVMIGETNWVGNIEIHVNSSDWFKHNHHKDNAYDNIILHVVYNHDKLVYRSNGQPVATLVLKEHINPQVILNYSLLIDHKPDFISCEKSVAKVSNFFIAGYLEEQANDRLLEKGKEIDQIFNWTNNDWEQTFYIVLSRYFGMAVNSSAFEQLAKRAPLKIIENYKNILTSEALLFGQAGFLEEDNTTNEYFKKLRAEYEFLKNTYNLNSLDVKLWKFSRLRPLNFPTLRIAQLSSLLTAFPRLFFKLISFSTVKEIEQLMLEIKTTAYWDNNYRFSQESGKKQVKGMGKMFIHTFIINVVIPVGYYYAKYKENVNLATKFLKWLKELPPESNNIIQQFNSLGFLANKALDTQGLIHLYREYCSLKRCANCKIGDKLIKAN